MIVRGAHKVKSIVKELFELDGLLKEFERLKAEQVAALRLGTPQEALVKIEDELQKVRKNIYARDSYTNPRRHINWN
jgi:hypothetical protein